MTIMNKCVDLSLGGELYKVSAPPFKRSRAWRAKLRDTVKPLFGKLGNLNTADYSDPKDILELWPVVETLLVEGLEDIFELVVIFDAGIEADRERIENSATDKEIFDAFFEILKLMDFFGVGRFLARKSGLETPLTSSSSPSENGVSAQVEPTP